MCGVCMWHDGARRTVHVAVRNSVPQHVAAQQRHPSTPKGDCCGAAVVGCCGAVVVRQLTFHRKCKGIHNDHSVAFQFALQGKDTNVCTLPQMQRPQLDNCADAHTRAHVYCRSIWHRSAQTASLCQSTGKEHAPGHVRRNTRRRTKTTSTCISPMTSMLPPARACITYQQQGAQSGTRDTPAALYSAR